MHATRPPIPPRTLVAPPGRPQPADDDRPVTLDAAGRAAVRALAIEYARSIIDTPTGATVADLRHVVRVLVHELDAVTPTGPAAARQALAEARSRPQLCPGTSQFVPADVVDDNGDAVCPRCHVPQMTMDIDGAGRWHAVVAHLARP